MGYILNTIQRLFGDKKREIRLLGFLEGAVLYVMIYGLGTLIVNNDAFLINLRADLPQHYLGWMFYRFSDCTWFTALNTLTYPDYNSIINTDSIPLIAVPLKLISFMLPDTFQYFGIWGLLCFALNGYLASFIFEQFVDDAYTVLVGAVFIIVSPPMMAKLFYQHSLASHFVILIAFAWIVYHREESKLSIKKELAFWILMGMLTISIHTYFVPMVGIILIGYSIHKMLKNKSNIKCTVFCVAGFILGALGNFALLGGFFINTNGDDSMREISIDYLYRCGANLDAFIGKGYITAKDGQGEGLSYLGFGIFALCFIIVIYVIYRLFIEKKKFNIDRRAAISLCITCAISIVVAIGPSVAWHDKLLYTIPYPNWLVELWKNFRGTGRFIWITYYVVMFGILLLFIKFTSNKVIRNGILILCLLLQLWDLSPFLYGRAMYVNAYSALTTTIVDPAWQYIGDNYEHVVAIPNGILNRSGEMYDIAYWAGKHQMTLNDFYLGRQDLSDTSEYWFDKLLLGDIDDTTVYIFSNDTIERAKATDLYLVKLDNWYIGTKTNISDVIGAELL